MNQRKNKPGNKLTADISPKPIIAAFQPAANRYAVGLLLKGKALFAAKFLVNIKGAFQQSLAAPQGNSSAKAKGQRKEKAQGAAAFTTIQNRSRGLHKARRVNGYPVALSGNGCSQPFQTINAGQNILTVIDPRKDTGVLGQSRPDQVTVSHTFGRRSLDGSGQPAGFECCDHVTSPQSDNLWPPDSRWCRGR